MYGNEPFVKHPKEAPKLKSMRSAGFRLSATDVFSTETFLFTGTSHHLFTTNRLLVPAAH